MNRSLWVSIRFTMSGEKILITGASGSVGRALTIELSKNKKYCIAVTVNQEFKNNAIFGANIKHIDYMSDTFKREVEEFSPDAVIHLASFSTSNDDIKSIKNLVSSNIVFLSLLLDALKSTSLRLFVNTGSFSEYYFNDGKLNPAYFYAATKTASRAVVAYYKNILNMKACTIVPYTIYGANDKAKKLYDYVFDSLGRDTPVDMTQGYQILDFIHIDDVVSFYVHILENMDLLQDEQDYHLGTGVGTDIRSVACLAEDITGMKANINWGKVDYRRTDIMKAIAPIRSLQEELNLSPKISLRKGMKLSYDLKMLGEISDS